MSAGSDPEQAWSLPAPAKLNLVLRIVGRRADGYHLLETLFHALELHDDLVLARSGRPGIELDVTSEVPGQAVPAGPDNLVVVALQRYAARLGQQPAFRVRLHKRIPAGGGLGGGSSDAAAALRLANAACGEPLTTADLFELARPLGADVPFFLGGGSQWGRGVGDELTPVEVPPQQFLLLLPPFGCPTAEVYKNYAALWNSGLPQASVSSSRPLPHWDSALRMWCSNDLEPAAERVRPELGALRQQVAAAGFSDLRMSGSGSTLFLAFGTAAARDAAAARLAMLQQSGVRLLATASAAALAAPTAVRWSAAGADGRHGIGGKG